MVETAGMGPQPWPGEEARGPAPHLPWHCDGQEARAPQLPVAKKLPAPAAPVVLLKTKPGFFLLR